VKVFFLALIFSLSSFTAAKTVLVMGDSLTEGYRLAKEEAYPYLMELELKKKYPDVKIINGGISGSTSASAVRRLDWYLKAKPEIMILALGANDGLRGLKVEETSKNLEAVILKAKSSGIRVIVSGMKMPPNYGKEYSEKFNQIFPRLAKKHELKLIPFILENVAGIPALNLPDGIHPNPEGHKVMAKNVMKFLEAEL
jgi:acyl-CoA thioesterase-1